MLRRLAARLALVAGTGGAATAAVGVAVAGETNVQETLPLIWAITVIAVAGAFATYFVLAWALIKFRDPATKGRKYG